MQNILVADPNIQTWASELKISLSVIDTCGDYFPKFRHHHHHLNVFHYQEAD